MSDANERYRDACALIEAGRNSEAVEILWPLYEKTHDLKKKIDYGITLLPALNQAENHQKLIEVCTTGIKNARALKLADALAIFLARRAVTLLQKRHLIIHQMHGIKLPPTWFNFATERERNEYENLERRFQAIEKESLALLNEALNIPLDRGLQYQILLEAAEAKGQLLSSYNFLHAKAKRTLFKKVRLKLRDKEKRAEFRNRFKEMKRLYLTAAAAGLAAGDETAPAYCYFQLALEYRVSFRFVGARYYLYKAERIAKKHNVQRIIKGVKDVKKDLTLRKVSGDDIDPHDITLD